MVVLEKLEVRNLVASARGTVEQPGKNVRAKAGLNRAILDQGWYAFEQMLAYKLEKRGGQLLHVPAAYTSQRCSVCAHTTADNRRSQAAFCCVSCGHAENADTNAAKNIVRAGLALVGAPTRRTSAAAAASPRTRQKARMSPRWLLPQAGIRSFRSREEVKCTRRERPARVTDRAEDRDAGVRHGGIGVRRRPRNRGPGRGRARGPGDGAVGALGRGGPRCGVVPVAPTSTRWTRATWRTSTPWSTPRPRSRKPGRGSGSTGATWSAPSGCSRRPGRAGSAGSCTSGPRPRCSTGGTSVDVDEGAPYPDPHPFVYGATKALAEQAVLAADAPGFVALSLRPRLIWGPRDTTVLPAVLAAAAAGRFAWVDGGRALTSTTHVANLVDAVLAALTRGAGGRAYFVVDDGTRPYRAFFEALAATRGVTLPGRSVPGWLARPLSRAVERTWLALGRAGIRRWRRCRCTCSGPQSPSARTRRGGSSGGRRGCRWRTGSPRWPRAGSRALGSLDGETRPGSSRRDERCATGYPSAWNPKTSHDGHLEPLSGLDAMFLYLETPTSPMHVGSLSILEGRLAFDTFRSHLASRLHLVKSFRQRLVEVPLGLNRPYWADDPNFDLDWHLHHTALPKPGDWKQLRRLASRVFGRPLDRSRPLWEMSSSRGSTPSRRFRPARSG